MLKNIFDIPVIGPILRSPWPWRFARLLCLAVVLVMIAAGWHYHAIPGVEVPDPLMYTSLTTHLFWVWWLMGIVVVALFFGRGWCAICPLGWLNGLASRFGLQRPLPGWLRNFIPVTLTLVALQLAVYFLAIHRYPDYTAALLALILLLAILLGLVFRKRAFCSLLCPAGAVFGLYARVAPFALRVKESKTCAACSSKDCVSGAPFWKRLSLGPATLFWHGRRNDCPVGLVPAEIKDSSACTLCLHCAHNCGQENIRLGGRPWLGDFARGALSPSESLFFVVLLGLLTTNFSKVYLDLRELLLWAPEQAALALGWESTGYYLLGTFWVGLVLPLLLLLPGYLIWRLADLKIAALPPQTAPENLAKNLPDLSAGPGFWRRLGFLALPFIPLLLTVHLILALVKINAKAGYLPLALRDASGVKSYLALNVMNTMQTPGALLSLDVLKWIVLALLVTGYLLSLHGAWKADCQVPAGTSKRGYRVASVIGVSLVASLYAATIVRWLFIR